MTRLAAFLALVRKEGAAAAVASRWRRGGTAPPHTSHTWRRKRSRRGEVRGRGGGREEEGVEGGGGEEMGGETEGGGIRERGGVMGGGRMGEVGGGGGGEGELDLQLVHRAVVEV